MLRILDYRFDLCTFSMAIRALRYLSIVRARELDVLLMHQLTAMLDQGNPDIQTFMCLRDWALGNHATTPYQMVTHTDRRPVPQHFR